MKLITFLVPVLMDIVSWVSQAWLESQGVTSRKPPQCARDNNDIHVGFIVKINDLLTKKPYDVSGR